MLRLILLALAFSAVTAPTPDSPIAIRHDVDDLLYLELGAKYPAALRLGVNGGNGTLIASDWVLTAAHVAEGMVRRGGGSVQVLVDGQDGGYEVDQVVLHPDFVHMGPFDLALLHLDRPVTNVVPVGLYRLTDELGKAIVLVGHGDTKRGSGGDWVMDEGRRGATNVIDAVNRAHLVFDFDAPGTATDLEGTAGPGDSGGPAFIEVDGLPFVAGVSSLGEPGENGPGTYGAREHYVRVSSHAEWIDSVMSDPPKERLVNMPKPEANRGQRRVVTGGPGRAMPGVVTLEEIGLLVADRDGQVRMVGRIDQRFPKALLDGGIRPPAAVLKLDDREITSAADLRDRFSTINSGSTFTLEFEHRGKIFQFELTK